MSLYLYLSGISLGRYCQKSPAKRGGFGKKIKRVDGHIVGVVYRKGGGGGVQTFHILCKCIPDISGLLQKLSFPIEFVLNSLQTQKCLELVSRSQFL